MRDEGQPAGVVFANFLVHNLHYLNITPLKQVSVNGFLECGMRCVAVSSCFSVNVGAFADLGQKTLCELLPADKDKESSKFVVSESFHHFSIMTPCLNNPCKNGATCLANYRDDSLCAKGYIGRNCELKGFPFHWRLDGTDKHITLQGASKFEKQQGGRVLFLNGIYGTYAETPAVPIHTKDLSIALWVRLLSLSYQQPIYGDWSAPHSFRLFVAQNGSSCFQVRDRSGLDLYAVCTDSIDVVPGTRWSHLAVTWNRAHKRLRMFTNGEMKLESTAPSNRNTDFMNSSHQFYDIGLKRDTGAVAHAFFSDLMVFDRELSFSPTQSAINEIKDEIFGKHPLKDYV
ncbi:uncharacterized protein [Montipora foliosa]|uniref:uncharacterized protein n=1 Tax=Montipora foliosa TaxID=591990 RepID=UPI0035F11F47